ncbi:hypothetical protein ACHAW6_014839 [Cyclotella cf. meneghiniana]
MQSIVECTQHFASAQVRSKHQYTEDGVGSSSKKMSSEKHIIVSAGIKDGIGGGNETVDATEKELHPEEGAFRLGIWNIIFKSSKQGMQTWMRPHFAGTFH